MSGPEEFPDDLINNCITAFDDHRSGHDQWACKNSIQAVLRVARLAFDRSIAIGYISSGWPSFEEKSAINKRFSKIYEEGKRSGVRGHYETMFSAMHQAYAEALNLPSNAHGPSPKATRPAPPTEPLLESIDLAIEHHPQDPVPIDLLLSWREAVADLNEEAHLQLEALEAKSGPEELRALVEALKPFAHIGGIIDELFFPAIFRDGDDAFQSGCSWTENGERKTLTWGDFRRARAALTRAESSLASPAGVEGDGPAEIEIDRLRLAAFKSNSDEDIAAYYSAASKWFQDRHYRAMLSAAPRGESE